jgi:hypothetical protein
MMRRYERACLMPEPTIDYYDDPVELALLFEQADIDKI